ncbi:ABC transporter permease [Candidatus Woesearchaeota archaeon]|jgi:ABC-2 type transport system permease protein|nr:ABC transporter permease [Candidatus Woesearchaeota archaeon]MBT4110377.1 ABC transporter permease [Candidatus Woesearchaeota archaeon]MBT4336099.1 ABC transporter permease [Candidatus Woesearchaeota archaeon]MBT4468922.1 ABC transporter permease [Candidatus Woesearchaeota archaeon]MBT6744759.1 ABC transporter permease [Candidatus Woesearchaeota archaeon]
MRSLWLLTKKNIKLLVRSKASALIIIFAPLIIILLLGLSYNTSEQYGLNIGIYAPSYTEDVNSFIAVLQEEEFSISKYESSLENCIDDVKKGTLHTCISLPESLQPTGNEQKEVTFHIDPSKVNLVWMIQETVKSKFNIKAQEISQELTQDVLTRITSTKNTIAAKKTEVDALKEKTSSASSTAAAAKSSLSGLDLNAPVGVYDTTAIAGISTSLSTAVTKIEKAITAVDNANITSSKTAIKKPLQDALDELSGSNVSDSVGIGAMVTAMQADLTAAKEKLTAAASAVDSTNSNLASVTSALSESATTIDSVQAGLNEVINTIEGQKITDANTITNPLTTKIEKVSEDNTFLGYLFPSILILVLMFSSLLLGTTLVMMEKTSPAFLRNFFLPIKKATFVISTYLTNLVLILVQIVVILGISMIFLKDSWPDLPAVALVLFIVASVFTFLGMVIGYIFNSEETAVLASISLGSILLFFSGTIFPLEGIASWLRQITYFNPFVIGEKLVREVFIFHGSLGDVWLDLVILIGYALVLFIVIMIVESILHKHLVNRFMRHHHRAHVQKDKKNKKDA